jgi:hypothetical protein
MKNGSSRGYLVLERPVLGLFCWRQMVDGKSHLVFLESLRCHYASDVY